jgi:hypothetical protein
MRVKHRARGEGKKFVAMRTPPPTRRFFPVKSIFLTFKKLVLVKDSAVRASLFQLMTPPKFAKPAEDFIVRPLKNFCKADCPSLGRQQKMLPFQFCTSASHNATHQELFSRGIGTEKSTKSTKWLIPL